MNVLNHPFIVMILLSTFDGRSKLIPLAQPFNEMRQRGLLYAPATLPSEVDHEGMWSSKTTPWMRSRMARHAAAEVDVAPNYRTSSLSLRLVGRQRPWDDIVDGLQVIGSSLLCHPSYEASGSCLGGKLVPVKRASLRWSHRASPLGRQRTKSRDQA